jgi:hypothetical protein
MVTYFCGAVPSGNDETMLLGTESPKTQSYLVLRRRLMISCRDRWPEIKGRISCGPHATSRQSNENTHGEIKMRHMLRPKVAAIR